MAARRLLFSILTLSLTFGLASKGVAAEKSLTLEIGDPARREKRAPLVWDAITDTRTGDLLSPPELARRLKGKRLVLVGESHTDMNFHVAQLRVLRELQQAGRKVLVGLEMFPYTKQEHLDRWVRGELSEESFLEKADWYDSWGYHWQYYREIFVFARDNQLPMYALNTPRSVISAVRRKGFDELTDEQRRHMPPAIDTASDEHFQLFQAFFEDEEEEFHAQLTEEQWQGMFAAQCTWDATFGHQALRALERHPDPQSVLVVLVGTGHVAYDLGIQRQMAQWSDIEIATVVPIPIREWDEEETIAEVQASYADFLWGMPPEADPIYPTLGVSSTSRGQTHLKVIFVAPESVGERAGLQVGDLLLEMDSQALADQAALRRWIAQKSWGDRALLKVQRGEEILDVDLAFRRVLPELDEEEGAEGEEHEQESEER